MAISPFEGIIAEVRAFAAAATNLSALQEFCVGIIAQRLANYNWVGFYMIDPGDENVLVLGPFRGAPTEHVRIPVTQGICGAAVDQGETVIVEVCLRTRGTSPSSLETRSEIVVPIRVRGKIAGGIDIDSHTLNAFGADDRRFLEKCAEILGQFLER